jgi:SAM-dependent methyltransferase
VHVADASDRLDALRGRFDLIVSWQVLEHVRRLDAVVENCRTYLRPGGAVVALFSGTFAFFAVAGRLVPHRIAKAAMGRLLGRDPRSVFPAHYHHTWYTALERCFARGWEPVEIVPLYRGADYLRFAPLLQRAYLRYEDWAAAGRPNLATHYLLYAVKAREEP